MDFYFKNTGEHAILIMNTYSLSVEKYSKDNILIVKYPQNKFNKKYFDSKEDWLNTTSEKSLHIPIRWIFEARKASFKEGT